MTERKRKSGTGDEPTQGEDLTPALVNAPSSEEDEYPAPPPWLSDKAREAYTALAPVLVEMGRAKATDYHSLAMWCEEYATYVWAIHDLRVNGRVQKTRTGYEQVRPAYGVSRGALDGMSRIGKEIGLTIRSRSVVQIEEDVNKLSEEFRAWMNHDKSK